MYEPFFSGKDSPKSLGSTEGRISNQEYKVVAHLYRHSMHLLEYRLTDAEDRMEIEVKLD
jgi:hypothetical protein